MSPEPSPPDPTNAEVPVTPPEVDPVVESTGVEPERVTQPVATKADLPPDFVDETLPQTAVRLLGQTIRAAQPQVKSLTIQALRSTIQLLEQTVDRLEAPPTPKGLPTEATPLDFSPTTQTFWQQVQTWWNSVLAQVRSVLPASVQSISNSSLTGILALMLVAVIWTTSSVLSGKPQPTAVATTPPPVTPTPTQPIPPAIDSPQPAQPIRVAPPIVVKPTAPPLKRSPEQPLIALIQDQVAEVSDRYANGLIQSVQASFRSSRLSVKVADGWYDLTPTQQNKLADEMLRRTQKLDFSNLEIVDANDTPLARSPVIGTEMIILQRTH